MKTYKVKLQCQNCKHVFNYKLPKGEILRYSSHGLEEYHLFIGPLHQCWAYKEVITKGFLGLLRTELKTISNPEKTKYIRCSNCFVDSVEHYERKPMENKSEKIEHKNSHGNSGIGVGVGGSAGPLI